MQVAWFISDTQPPIYFHTSSWYWGLRSCRFPRAFILTQWLFFFGYCAHLWDMHYICTSKWDIYFRDSATKLSMDIPQMLWKFCIFTGHLPKHHGCLFQTFWTFPEHVLDLFQTFQKFSSPIYLCTSGWRSRSSAFFQDVYPSTRAVFVGYSGHSLHLYYTWHIYFRYFGQIFWTFSTSFICAHSMDAPEVPHFFWHLVPHLFVHILGMLWNFCIFSGHLLKHQGCFFFGYSRHSQDMYYIWHMYFRYFRHPVAHLFVHILLMLWKFRTFCMTFIWVPGLFLLDILDTPKTCVHLAYFISDISDIQCLIYLCTFCWFPRSTAFFQDNYLSTRAVSFRYSRHSWDMYYIFTCGWHIYFRHFGYSAP